MLAILFLAIALRVVRYLQAPPLLIDEVRMALNIGSRSWWGLTYPLDHDQTAPVLFLWTAKLLTEVAGLNEYALRALPLAAGILSLPLVYVIARRIVDEYAARLATALIGFSPLFIQYATEVKPYSLDLALALALALVASWWIAHPARFAPPLVLFVLGSVAVWASTPSIFVLLGMTPLLGWRLRRERRGLGLLLGCLSAWALAFVVEYQWIYRSVAHSPYMQQFWAGNMLTVWEPGFVDRLWSSSKVVLWELFAGQSINPPLPPDAMLVTNLGAVAWILMIAVGTAAIRRRGTSVEALLLLGGVLVAVGASLVGRFPLGARLFLFGLPVLAIAAASGLTALVRRLKLQRASVRMALALILVAPALPQTARRVFFPEAVENVREAVNEFQARSLPGESVYILAASLPAWTFYTTDWAAPDTARLARVARLASYGGPSFENAAPRSRPVQRAEGDHLVAPYAGHIELYGLAHGAQLRAGTGMFSMRPDTNWVLVEACRIRRAAAPGVWAIVSHSYQIFEREVHPQLMAWGGRPVYVHAKNGAIAVRYEFTGEGNQTLSPC